MTEPRAPIREAIPVALDSERLDRAVAMLTGVTRAEAGALVRDGRVQVAGEVVTRGAHRLSAGDDVAIELPAAPDPGVGPDASVPLVIVHEDPDLVVLDKPAGVVVHPGAGHPSGTLVQGLLARYPELAVVGDPARPGIVHRLDRGTSGLLAVARTPVAYDSLVRQLTARTVEREYDALVRGRVEEDEGIVDAPIARSSRSRTRMAVRRDGRAARTRFRVVDRWRSPGLSRLVASLETGRTHQIRVHLAAIGHPVVGDERYGGGQLRPALDRPFLHAARLALVHPVSGRRLEWHAPLPEDLEAALDELGPPE